MIPSASLRTLRVVAEASVSHDRSAAAEPTSAGTFDFTSIPFQLDANFEARGLGNSLRAAIINMAPNWTRQRQASLLAQPVEESIYSEQRTAEKRKAFELLDALTKSGGLRIEDASVPVVVAAVHSFDNTLMNTLVQDNVNPIESLERSVLVAAATIHG